MPIIPTIGTVDWLLRNYNFFGQEGEMVGLILALLYACYSYFAGEPLDVFYPAALTYLLWWYVIWAVIAALFYLLLALLLSLGLGILGFERGSLPGGVLGFLAGGGTLSVILLVNYVVRYGSLIGGTILLRGAYEGGCWDIVRVVLGAILLVIGLLVPTRCSSSSSLSSKD